MDEFSFSARRLKPYAEPVDAAQLIEGEIYYRLSFYDEAMLIPDFEALVFVGKFSNDQGVEYLRFQDVDSYRNGVRYQTASKDDDADFFQCAEAHAGSVFEFEKALEQLMKCSLRRNGSRGD